LFTTSSSSLISITLLLVGISSITLLGISSLGSGSTTSSSRSTSIKKPLLAYLEAQPALVYLVYVRYVKQLVKEEDSLPKKIYSDIIKANINY